jgi:hypothetical protein
MTYLEAMRDYYSGQRYVGLAITVFLIAGLFMLPANVIYFFYVAPQSARIESALARSPSEFDASESAHLNRMMNGFHRSYRFVDFMVVGYGLSFSIVPISGGTSPKRQQTAVTVSTDKSASRQ